MTYYSAPISKLLDTSVGARQVLAVISDPSLDRTNDVMRPEGCILDNYRRNAVVLANHNVMAPIGTAKPAVRNNRVEALIDFAPAGVSKIADEFCGLVKSGILSAFSVGFDPHEYEPNGLGGYTYKTWELLEVSVVAVPANSNAVTVVRSHGTKTGRVLSEANAALVDEAHGHVGAAHRCLTELKAAGRLPADAEPDPAEADEDEELAFEALLRKRAWHADRRRRLIAIAAARARHGA